MRKALKTAAAGVVATMVVGGAVATGTTGAAQADGRGQLAGTWAVYVDPDGPRPAFTSTLVYTSTGSVIETTMNRPPSMISTGLGTWQRLGDGQFAVTHRKYRWSPTEFLGTVVVHEVSQISQDGKSYSARATTSFFDPSGEQDMAPVHSSVTAERL